MSNDLAQQHSPYLRQHAHQPVAWQAWSPAAFLEARTRKVPVIVSIGYSTCHWCHVMAHESFDDQAIADFMNHHFVCIKVDREEHPEVDSIYMDTVQAITGHGGWPLNAFTDGDGKPFYACTYLPPAQWLKLLNDLSHVWVADPGRIHDSTARVMEVLNEAEPVPGDISHTVLEKIDQLIERHFDHENPAIGSGQMRFPPHQLLALLVYSQRTAWHQVAEKILEAMQDAGIHDVIGGGFHRYSTTRDWRLPHFEKMLYDNAQLMVAFAQASVVSQRPDFQRTAVAIGDYLLRDLRVERNGIFQGYACAEDADDAGGEGSFYAWSPDELIKALGKEDGQRLISEWDLHPGHAERGPHGHMDPVLRHIPHPRGVGVPAGEVGYQRRASWIPFFERLRAWRSTRPRPSRDDKILTDQNALALEGFAVLARITGEARFFDATRELADVIMRRHYAEGLQRLVYVNSETTAEQKFPAFITDYGTAVAGLMAAFDALGDPCLVDAAERISGEAIERLRANDGGFYTTPVGRDDLVRRGRDATDNASPAGQNSLALGLVRLWNVTGHERWRDCARGIMRSSAEVVTGHPHAMTTLLRAWTYLESGHVTALVFGAQDDARTQELLLACRQAFVPNMAIIPMASCAHYAWASLKNITVNVEPQVQICLGTVCLAPAKNSHELTERCLEAQAMINKA